MKRFFLRLIIILSFFFLDNTVSAAVKDNLINVKFEKFNTSNKIKFSSATPIYSAIFLSGNRIWFVIDKQIDISKLDWRSMRMIKNASIIQQDAKHTIGCFEILNSADYEISATNQDNDIIINITPYDNSILLDELSKERKITKDIQIKNSSVDIQLYSSKSTVFNFIDPFTGEALFIIPEVVLARTSSKTFVDFITVESLSGIVIKSLNDSLRVKIKDKQVNVSSTAYLNISALSPDISLSSTMLKFDQDSQAILDLSYYNAKPQDFTKSLKKFNTLVNTTYEPVIKAERFLNLSLFLLANKWYVEAKSMLELVHRNSNIIANNDKIKMIVAATYFMADAFNEAYDISSGIDLKDVSIESKSEIGFWQKLCSLMIDKSNNSIKDKENTEFDLNIIMRQILSYKTNFLNNYNSDIFNKICFKVAESAIALEKFDIVRGIINILSKIKLDPNDQKKFNYIYGKLLTYYGDNTKALEVFKGCMDDINDGYYYSRCKFEALNIMYKLGKIQKTDYINNLQGISTVWRGDNFEYQVLDTLANFYNESNSAADAIRVWKMIDSNYPGSYKALTSTAKASQVFFDYLHLSSDSKLAKLGFFYEFKDLIPLGDAGDEIIMQIAGYMLDLDLADQAIKLIEYQIKNRLLGISREYVINDLINIYSHLNKWDLAEQTVELFSKMPLNVTNPVIAERRYLYVEALINNGQMQDAIAVLYGDITPEADDLRAKAFFKLADWTSFNENSEPYLYSIRNIKNGHLNDSDYVKILRQNISYFSGSQLSLLNDLYLDMQPRLKKGQKNAERNRLFYNIANELSNAAEMSQDKKARISSLIDQFVKS
jgi:hypothetical protein